MNNDGTGDAMHLHGHATKKLGRQLLAYVCMLGIVRRGRTLDTSKGE
ncbi:MAG: hypothetical protein JWQ49_3874 [Edaphobacter sp.]|nr:hypothetical protein [Edaphobacter sp.]